MDEIIKELAKSIAETNRDMITAVFNDYKEYIDTSDIAYLMSDAFHKMIWDIEEKEGE